MARRWRMPAGRRRQGGLITWLPAGGLHACLALLASWRPSSGSPESGIAEVSSVSATAGTSPLCRYVWSLWCVGSIRTVHNGGRDRAQISNLVDARCGDLGNACHEPVPVLRLAYVRSAHGIMRMAQSNEYGTAALRTWISLRVHAYTRPDQARPDQTAPARLRLMRSWHARPPALATDRPRPGGELGGASTHAAASMWHCGNTRPPRRRARCPAGEAAGEPFWKTGL